VARPGHRVGVDIGGTCTDLVLVRDGAPSIVYPSYVHGQSPSPHTTRS